MQPIYACPKWLRVLKELCAGFFGRDQPAGVFDKCSLCVAKAVCYRLAVVPAIGWHYGRLPLS